MSLTIEAWSSTCLQCTVLGKEGQETVGWPTSYNKACSRANNKVSKFDGKARVCHLEAVKARIIVRLVETI